MLKGLYKLRIIFTLLIALNIVYGAVSGIAFRDYNADGR